MHILFIIIDVTIALGILLACVPVVWQVGSVVVLRLRGHHRGKSHS
ncbi:MAG: hypothetical protein OEW39_09995 [Deltaproteobacteria bacterium]|nr:hypothetical protein [Deltaproteobacteria bacterium]